MKPTVALIAHGVHDNGGMERACAELLRHAHREFTFTVVSAELAPELRPLVREWVRVRVPSRPIPLKMVMFWMGAGRRLRSVDVDLVHSVGAIVPNRIDVAAVHFCHAGYSSAQGHLAPPSAPFMRRLNTTLATLLALAAERWCYRPSRVRAFAAVSVGVREELVAHYPGVKVHVTPNGIDLDRFRPNATARVDLRSAAGLTDEPVAVFVGGDWDHKGLAAAMQALAAVRERGIALQLWVVGRGNQDRFTALAKKWGVASAVSFFGERQDVERLLAAADMFVLPSLYETFSLVGFEAAATGLPIVVTRVHGIGDLVRDEGGGILVGRTTASLADALATLASDPNLRRCLGRRALRGSQKYSWTASIGSVTSLYRSLLRNEKHDPR